MEWLYYAIIGALTLLFLIVLVSICGTYVVISCSLIQEYDLQENEKAGDLERQLYLKAKREVIEAKERVDTMLMDAYGISNSQQY